jgi:hypothetical protein
MWEDPIVKEVRKVREEQSAKFGHDLRRLYRELKEREKESGRSYVSYPPRQAKQVAAGRHEKA